MRVQSILMHCCMRILVVCGLFSMLQYTSRAEEGKPVQTGTTVTKPVVLFEDHFASATLDTKHWKLTCNGDFRELKTDIVGTSETDRRLRFLARSADGENNIHGVRTVNPVIDIKRPIEVKFDFDWNHPKASLDMTAGIYICPTISNTDAPGSEENCIMIMYHGVDNKSPENAYLTVNMRCNDQETVIEDDGYQKWIDTLTTTDNPKDFKGRKIGLQHIRIVLSQQSITVWENDQQFCTCTYKDKKDIGKTLPWTTAYLYLEQRCSDPTKPAREIFWGNISVRQL